MPGHRSVSTWVQSTICCTALFLLAFTTRHSCGRAIAGTSMAELSVKWRAGVLRRKNRQGGVMNIATIIVMCWSLVRALQDWLRRSARGAPEPGCYWLMTSLRRAARCWEAALKSTQHPPCAGSQIPLRSSRPCPRSFVCPKRVQRATTSRIS